jgi:dihydrofolate reductase
MGKIVAFLSMTLDGVVQSPGRPDEDTRGGFPFGGWAAPYAEPDVGLKVGQSMASAGALLLGRRTYEDFYGYWPHQTDNPFTEVLHDTPKYVASTTLREPLPWNNSILLKGDVPSAVADLRSARDKNVVVLGSTALVQSLIAAGVIDEYLLLIHPLVLGTGRRLFPDGWAGRLGLADATPTKTGVVVATYQPQGGVS